MSEQTVTATSVYYNRVVTYQRSLSLTGFECRLLTGIEFRSRLEVAIALVFPFVTGVSRPWITATGCGNGRDSTEILITNIMEGSDEKAVRRYLCDP